MFMLNDLDFNLSVKNFELIRAMDLFLTDILQPWWAERSSELDTET